MRREIHVALLDPRSDAQFVYPATILCIQDCCPRPTPPRGGISFAPRRFAYMHGQQIPTLHASGKVDAAVLNAAEYFVTVHLAELLPGVRAEAASPKAARFTGVGESPLLVRVDAEAREGLFGRRRVSVSRLALARQQAPSRAVTRRSLLERKLLFVSPLAQERPKVRLSERSRESPTCSGSSRRRTACPFAEACILRTAGLCQPVDRGRVLRPR